MLYEQAVLWLNLTLQFQAVIARHYKDIYASVRRSQGISYQCSSSWCINLARSIDKSHGRFRTGLSIVLRETVDIHNKFLYIVVYEK